jgi:hypothetical protein
MNFKIIKNPAFSLRPSSFIIPYIRPSSFGIRHSIRLPAGKSDASCPALKADGHLARFHDHRNFAGAFGMLQHDVQFA